MKRKFIYFISAIIMAVTLSVSGVGNSYIKAEASSGLLDPLWNTNATTIENIKKHLELWAVCAGCFVSPSSIPGMITTAQDFYNFMINEGYPEDVANAVCHGGGGFVRDGINRDKDGNVTYSDDVSDLFHKYIMNYIQTDSGYYVVETMSANECYPLFGVNTVAFDNFVQTVKNFGALFCNINTYSSGNFWICLYDLPSLDFIDTDFVSTKPFETVQCIANGSIRGALSLYIHGNDMSHDSFIKAGPVSRSDLTQVDNSTGFKFPIYSSKLTSSGTETRAVVTTDGRLVKVFTSQSAFMGYNIKQQNFYWNDSFNTYNSNLDNSITISNSDYSTYIDSSSTIYNNIQYNIDNGGDNLTEDDIRRIVDDTLKDFLDNLPEEEEDNKDDDTGGGTVSGDDTGGNGLNDFVGGLGSLLDFLLSLFGKVIGLISDFLNSALELLGNLTSFTDGFSMFLSSTFKFLPEEAITLICSGIALVITLGIIKYMRN